MSVTEPTEDLADRIAGDVWKSQYNGCPMHEFMDEVNDIAAVIRARLVKEGVEAKEKK